MHKLLAVIKHEYKKIVFRWTFLLATFMFPALASVFGIIPTILFSIKGEPLRIVVIDQSGKISQRFKENLSAEKIATRAEQSAKDSSKDLTASQDEKMKQNARQAGSQTVIFVDYNPDGKSPEQIRNELSEKISKEQLDGYLIIPENFDNPNAKFDFFSRKSGDFVSNTLLKDSLNEAVYSQRLADANINEAQLKDLSRDITLDTKGVDKTGNEINTDGSFVASFIIGLMIYITLAIYGQAIMAAVVEEKETRIAEILFSSARPFELLLGKLTGVGLAGLTQISIWIISASVLAVVLASGFSSVGWSFPVPNITPLMIIYFFIFFLIGFFLYASIFALIGSMVTSVQEAGQFALPPIMILLVSFMLGFAVIRDPNSTLAFWISIAPFFAPIIMPIRIMAETPPFWQIALSIFINGLAIIGMVGLASRVYRVGMLMYGKRATIPEVWKWIWQA